MTNPHSQFYQPGYEPNTATITIPRRDMITLYKLVSARLKKMRREQIKKPWNPTMGETDIAATSIKRLEATLAAIREQVGDPKI